MISLPNIPNLEFREFSKKEMVAVFAYGWKPWVVAEAPKEYSDKVLMYFDSREAASARAYNVARRSIYNTDHERRQ
jgi:hypothetical protein